MIARVGCSVMPVVSVKNPNCPYIRCARPCGTRQLLHQYDHRRAESGLGHAPSRRPGARHCAAIAARAAQPSGDQIRLPVNYYSILQVLTAARQIKPSSTAQACSVSTCIICITHREDQLISFFQSTGELGGQQGHAFARVCAPRQGAAGSGGLLR